MAGTTPGSVVRAPDTVALVAVRVLWLSKGLGPGGAERLLAETAAVTDPDRIHLTAAFVRPDKDHLAGDLERAGVQVRCLSLRLRDLSWPRRLRRLLASGDFDIVHSHSPVPAVVARALAITLPPNRRPVLMTTEHHNWLSYHPLTRVANRLTGGMDAATFAVTAEAKSTMKGRAAERAEVLAHGIDVERVGALISERTAVRAEFGFLPDELVVGTVANFRAQKDYPNLLQAVRQLTSDGVPVRVVAVGQGPLDAEIRALIDDLDLDAIVFLAGFRSDAARVMAGCDIFTLASGSEGLPVALMEALALGLPVVATRVGGVAEVLSDEDAMLVPPSDPIALARALKAVLNDPGRRAELAAASRRLAPRFDVARAAELVSTTYDRLAAARASAETRRPRRMPTKPPSAHLRPMEQADRDQVIALLGASLGWEDDRRFRSLFAWKHDGSPFGPSIGLVADVRGEIVAVRLLMRWEFERGGSVVRAVRAVDTATHPEHQGHGLFTALTLEGLEQCRSEGVDLVFNTPNEQSRPGYLKMGWRDVGRLPVAIRPASVGAVARIARSRVGADLWSQPLELGQPVDAWLASDRWRDVTTERTSLASADRRLATRRGLDYLTWRYSEDDLAYRAVDNGEAAIIVRVRRRGSCSELVVAERFGALRSADALVGYALAGSGADYAIRSGGSDLRHGFISLPRLGPRLTWRAVNDLGEPPLPNWDLQLGDIELF